jgi:hypothetical protein
MGIYQKQVLPRFQELVVKCRATRPVRAREAAG